MTELYKTLINGRSHVSSFAMPWSLPVPRGDGDWIPGEWHRVDGPIVACRNGLHLSQRPEHWLAPECEIYLAEGRGENDASEAGDMQASKIAYQEARLLRPAPEMMPVYWQFSMEFTREAIPAVPWFRPDGEPDPAWKLFTGPTWSAARSAAWSVAESAAWSAAWSAAESAVWSAAGSAALFTSVEHICGDLPIDETHRIYAREQWRVWQKGYALLRDVGGALYVYAAETA